MTFLEAMAAVVAGRAVRRADWQTRRAIRLMPEPWSGERDKVLVFDRKAESRVAYGYTMPGDDVRATDWEIIEQEAGNG